MPDVPCLTPQQFTQLLLEELPIYEPNILRDIRPTDGLIGHISAGDWDAFDGVQHTRDRFKNVYPNVSKRWLPVSNSNCVGGNQAPCDPAMNEICWGWKRVTFSQERQSWKSQLLCFDQVVTVNKAVEHVDQIVNEILRPATSYIASNYIRKKALALAGTKIVANAALSPYTDSWTVVGDEEMYYNPSVLPTSKLTPEMIQRQLPRLRGVGYFGKWTNDPFFGGYDQFAELLTDDDTCWELDKIASNSRISDLWRFQMWDAAHEYYKYGMGGQIGNYMCHIDPFCLRFNKKSATQLQLVLPYKNSSANATTGIGSDWNTDFDNAQYQISFIWHRMAWMLRVQRMEAVNALMPFALRDLSGKWQFAMNDLGADCSGNPIANFRGNKGFFFADFQYAGDPLYTEFLTAILHLREPKFIYTIAPCAADPGYPTQSYGSTCTCCSTTLTFAPETASNGHYKIAASTATCNDDPVANGAIDAASLAALVTALNADVALGAIGTWSLNNNNQLVLTNGVCASGSGSCRVVIPWLAT